MQTYSTSVWTSASPDVTWRWLSDVERWPQWCPTFTSVTLLDRPMKVGARARVLQPGLRPATWSVDLWEPPRRFRWSASYPGIRVSGDHELIPDAGGVTVTLTLVYTGLLAPLMRKMLERRSYEYLSRELEAFQKVLRLQD